MTTHSATIAPTPLTTHRAPAAGPVETAAAYVAMALAVVAAVLGYRIIRGGRGL